MESCRRDHDDSSDSFHDGNGAGDDRSALDGARTARQPAKTTNSGVYTAAQAERGKKVFEAKCTACHDTARFTGEMFIDPWAGKPLKDVWDIASGTMPEDNPGSLPQQDTPTSSPTSCTSTPFQPATWN